MNYVLKQTIFDKARNAVSIDDFYYRGLENRLKGKLGTGLRDVAYNFILEGKILDRFLILSDNGDSLQIFTIFKNKETLNEFLWHPIMNEANTIFYEKQWKIETDIYPVQDYLSIRSI